MTVYDKPSIPLGEYLLYATIAFLSTLSASFIAFAVYLWFHASDAIGVVCGSAMSTLFEVLGKVL